MSVLRKRKIKTKTTRKIGVRDRNSESISVYIGDSEVNGIKKPYFGSITKKTMDLLGLKKAELQKMPNGGKYTTATGLNHDYTFVDGVLFKAVSGSNNGITYNSSSPVGIVKYPTKIKITVDGRVPADKSRIVGIGVPQDIPFASVLTFIVGLKLDKNPKVLRWKFGQASETLRELTGKSGSRSKDSAQGEWYIPIGLRQDVKRNQNGVLSASASAVSGRTLVVATVKETSAKLLGFTKAASAKLNDALKGTVIDKSFDNAGSSIAVSGSKYKNFAKLAAYSLVTKDTADGGTTSAITPGSSISIKVRQKTLKNTRAKQLAPGGSGTRTTRRGVSKSTYAYVSVPSATPIGMIHQFLMNTPIRFSSYQISADGKNYGNSYPLASKTLAN